MDIEKNISQQYIAVVPGKSPNDNRNYEALKLPNGLRILFVQDPALEKSACSVSVGVGSLEDPEASLGLAHFLEHMLFMGSKKFPSHNEYSSFININSGMDNAYTSDVQTNYYFEVANKAFIEGVERLTNFFTGALLTQSCVSKQTQAVHQEFVLWTNDDNCRKWQILKKLATGPYKRFSIGNTQTLSHPEIRNDLVKFYQTQYSADRINAVLCSSIPIEEMKKSVIPLFEEIQNKKLGKPHYQQFYHPENIGKLVRMQSIKEQTIMEFFWPVQNLKPHYKKHAQEYLTHVLGHEGKNSLFSHLKKEGLASEISSYHHDLASQTIIGLEIKLTVEGAEHFSQVYNTVIDYTASLKPEKEIYQQIKHRKQISFRFKEKTETYRYACHLSSKMHDIELEEILKFKYTFQEFDQDFLKRILKQINPFNLIVVYSNPEEIEGSSTEKYLGGKYKVQDLPERKVHVKQFTSLSKNQFIPLDINLVPASQDKYTPRKLRDNVRFLKDNNFKVCKGGVRITLHGLNDPTFREFYAVYLDLLLKQITYDAQSLHTQVHYQDCDNVQVQIFGFNDTVSKLITKLGENILALHTSEDSERVFTIAHDKILEDYQNFYFNEVDQIAESTLDNILRDQDIDIPTTIKILEDYDYKSTTQKLLDFLKNCSLSWLFVGNFDETNCLKLADAFEKNLSCEQKLSSKQIRCKQIEKNQMHLTKLQSEDISTSGCIVYYPAGIYSEKLFYTLHLLKNHVEEPFFNELRTEKQLAYYLTTRIVNTRGILGIYFILVSSSKDPHYISEEIRRFVGGFMAKMETQLTEEKLKNLKQSVKTKFSVPHNNLKAMFRFICQQIDDSTFNFRRKDKEQLEKQLDTISKEQLLRVWGEISQKRMEIHVLAKNHAEDFDKLGVQKNYSSFEELKKGNYYEDIISKNKNGQ